MLGDLSDSGMFVTPGTGKAGRSFDIDRGAVMFAMTIKAFEASRRIDHQGPTRDESSVGVSHVQAAMTILVREVAMTTTQPSFSGPRHGRWQVVQSLASWRWAANSAPGS